MSRVRRAEFVAEKVKDIIGHNSVDQPDSSCIFFLEFYVGPIALTRPDDNVANLFALLPAMCRII